MEAMPTRRFLAMAGRIAHYDGALRAAIAAEVPRPAAAPRSGPAPVPATKLNYDMNPELRAVNATFAEVARPAVLTPEQQAYVDAHPELQAPPRR